MKTKWFERPFNEFTSLHPEQFPFLLERLRGTPARLEDRIRDIPEQHWSPSGREPWTIQENVGHVLDLEPLWAGRLDDFLNTRKELRPADLENRKTHEADHNQRSMKDLLAEFRSARSVFICRLSAAGEQTAAMTAIHPRLKKPMRLIDMMYFVAEHDDHHLADITTLHTLLSGIEL